MTGAPQEDQILVDATVLQTWMQALFTHCGLAGDDAASVARVLVRTSLRGIDTHGVALVPLYVGMLDRGEANPRPQHGGEERGGTLFYRGDRGLAQVTAPAALRAALALAAERPIIPCLIEQAGHLGALGVVALEAAEAGMFAFVCQSTWPFMGLPGFTGKAMGNNPLAFAAPVPDMAPLVFDMAASVVARGRLAQAAQAGEPIPRGWALSPDGQDTTDAEQGLAGTMLPVGDYKGMGLAMLVQCLVSSLLGISPLLEQGMASTSEMGAFLLIINPDLASDGRFGGDMRHWLGTYLQAAGPNGRYPGQGAALVEYARSRTGIPVPHHLLQQLNAIGAACSIGPVASTRH